MFYIRHSTFTLRMMEIVDADWKEIIDYLWDTSEFIIENKLDKSDIIVEKINMCRLDPGGIYNMGEEWKVFEIDGYKFEMQLSKIDTVISKIKRAKERIPGYMRFGMWRWNTVVSNKLYFKLLEKLEELRTDDETLHAQITDYEIKQKLEDTGYCFFSDIPREE